MDIQDYAYGMGIQGVGMVSPTTSGSVLPQESSATGDTVSISEEARQLYLEMLEQEKVLQALHSQEFGAVMQEEQGDNVSSDSGDTSAHGGDDKGASSQGHSNASDGQDTSGQGGQGGGGGSGGAASSSDTSTTEASLEAEITALEMQIAQAEKVAQTTGDTSQVTALKGALASLESELAQLSEA